MQVAVASSAKRPRGRPSRAESRNVALDIMKAAEQCLERRNSRELTLTEIAEAAGVTEAMIGYYFKNKEGLYSALIEIDAKELSERLNHLLDTFRSSQENPTRTLVKHLIAVVEAHSGITAMILGERMRTHSEVKDIYARRYAKHSVTNIIRVITAFQQAGLYRPDIDLRYAALAMMTLACTRLTIAHVSSAMGYANEEFSEDPWVDYLTDMFDRMFRSGTRPVPDWVDAPRQNRASDQV